MVKERKLIGNFEEITLLAINKCATNWYITKNDKDRASGFNIIKTLHQAGYEVNPGALYIALARLENKNLVAHITEPPKVTRGGRRKKIYRVTFPGQLAIGVVQGIRDNLK